MGFTQLPVQWEGEDSFGKVNSGQGVELTIHLHLAPMLRKHEARIGTNSVFSPFQQRSAACHVFSAQPNHLAEYTRQQIGNGSRTAQLQKTHLTLKQMFNLITIASLPVNNYHWLYLE